jgi:hypothetical protein
MHQVYSVWPAATRIPNLDDRIEDANASYLEWFKYWEAYYSEFTFQAPQLNSQRAAAFPAQTSCTKACTASTHMRYYTQTRASYTLCAPGARQHTSLHARQPY